MVFLEKKRLKKEIKKETLAQVFSYEFCEVPKNTFFHRTRLGDCFWNIRNDNIVKHSANAKVAKSTLDNEIQNEIITSMTKLKEQNTLLSSLQQNVIKTTIRNWNLLIHCLPSNMFNFCRKALVFSLNKNSNLARWKIRSSPKYDLCGKTQTQIHGLNNCISAISDGRYKWRHDSILKTILCYIRSSNEY